MTFIQNDDLLVTDSNMLVTKKKDFILDKWHKQILEICYARWVSTVEFYEKMKLSERQVRYKLKDLFTYGYIDKKLVLEDMRMREYRAKW